MECLGRKTNNKNTVVSIILYKGLHMIVITLEPISTENYNSKYITSLNKSSLLYFFSQNCYILYSIVFKNFACTLKHILRC